MVSELSLQDGKLAHFPTQHITDVSIFMHKGQESDKSALRVKDCEIILTCLLNLCIAVQRKQTNHAQNKLSNVERIFNQSVLIDLNIIFVR